MNVLVPQYVVAKGYTQATDDTHTYAQLLSSTIGTDPTSSIWAVGTAYTTGQKVYYLDTEGVCNGCWCQYEATQNSTGKVPIDEPDYWVSLGAIEMYKMFDQYSNTRSTSTTSDITITLYCKAITDISFLNVQAKQIKINVWNAKPSTSYPYTANCTSGNKIVTDQIIILSQPIYNWYEYYFKNFEYIRSISESISVSLYHNLIIQIEFMKYDGLDCFAGAVLAGSKYDIGSLMYGVSTGIQDYSPKLFDETFGSHYIQEGNYRKLMDCDLRIKNENLNVVNNILTQLRARPTIWQGNQSDTSYDNLLVYGIPKSFTIIMQSASYSECSLEIEGLI